MKILHVVHAYPPSKGGSQQLTARLSEELVARYGDQVTVFTTVARNIDYFWGGDPTALPVGVEVINGVSVRRFPVFNRLNRLRWFASGVGYRLKLPFNDYLRSWETGPFVPGLGRAIRESGAEVIFATAFPLWHMFITLRAAKAAGIPLVFLGALHLDDAWGYDRPMILRAIQQADAYIAHTEYERDYLLQKGVISADKIHIIGGGVDLEPYIHADGTEARRSYGWGDAPVILALGKHVERKRFDLLLEAMRIVWQSQPTARVVIAGGRTQYSATLEALIRALPESTRRNVTLISDFADSQKAELLAASDIFVLPSGHESFGIALVEAWAARKPVIGAHSGAIPAVIDEGQDGLLFEFPEAESLAAALLQLLNHPEQRIELGAAGLSKVHKQYTWEKVVAQVREVYEGVLSR